MFQKIWEHKLVRFAAVGGFNTLLDLTILNILVLIVGLPTVVGNLISASICITISYFLYHRLVFRSKEPHSIKLFVHFFLVTGVGILVLQSLMIALVTHILGHKEIGVNHLLSFAHVHPLKTSFINLNVAKLCAVAVGLVWNYCLYHFVIFKTHNEVDEHVADAV
jgi:putative flippase GtrA